MSAVLGQPLVKTTFSLPSEEDPEFCPVVGQLLREASQPTDRTCVSVDLSSRELGIGGALQVVYHLRPLDHLLELDLNLSWAHLDESGTLALASGLHFWPRLQRLSLLLAGNSAGSSAVLALARAAGELPALTGLRLDLSLNSIGNIAVAGLLPALARLSELEQLELVLSWNSFDQQGAVELLCSLARATALAELSLSLAGSDIGDLGCLTLARSLACMPRLTCATVDLGVAARRRRVLREVRLAAGRLPLRPQLSLRGGWNGLASTGLPGFFDVVVVGGGPVGLALALELASRGSVHVRLFERRSRGVDGTAGAGGPVVTVPDNVAELFCRSRFLSSGGTEDPFAGARVWPESRNLSVRELERRLLSRAESAVEEGVVELLYGPPDDIWSCLNEGTEEANVQFKAWLESLGGDLVVAADGPLSFTREAHAGYFGWTSLASHMEDAAAETDQMLGVIVSGEADTCQPPILTMALSCLSLRYSFNPGSDGVGYLGIRLTPGEFAELTAEAGATFHPPPAAAGEEALPAPFRPSSSGFRPTLREGLRLFGYSERHVSVAEASRCTPAFARKFVHRDGHTAICLVGEAAISPHYWHGRGLATGLRSAAALARAVHSSVSSEALWVELKRFDGFMQDLREREMQGRSAALLAPGCSLPGWLDELEGCKPGLGPTKSSRTAEILQDACVRRTNLDDELAHRLRDWRDHLAGAHGAVALTDESIEALARTGPDRPRPLTSLVLCACAYENPPFRGGARGLVGLPVSRQLGTRKVQDEVSPALEHQGRPGFFRSSHVWGLPD